MIMRMAAAGAALICASVGLAGVANAEALEGTYTATHSGPGGGTLTQTWVFVSCGPGCARQTVSGMELHLQGNTWSGTQLVDGTQCATSIDATTLAGVTAACGMISIPVQLTKVG